LREVGVAVYHDLEFATRDDADAARLLGAERDHDRLARDSHRLDHREDLLDLLESDRFKHRLRMKPQMPADSQAADDPHPPRGEPALARADLSLVRER